MNLKRNLWLVMPLLMSLMIVNPKAAKADDHVMPLSELHQQAQAASQDRAKNVADIERVLSYPAASEALQKADVSEAQMQKAVATLDDAELARLADRARASEKDVQGGLIVGILALIGLIVVIIIVVALVG
jgi:hypothetical protein